MSKTPIIFLAFANDRDKHLDTLKEEIEGIRSVLFEQDDQGLLRVVYPVYNTLIKDIYDAFNRYKDRIVIFHYAGHANNETIFTHKQGADAENLSKLFKERAPLELVFLNGCSSKGQVKFFIDAGAKAVIATSGPIQDRKATDFAIRFYECIAQGDSIESAFNIAISELANHEPIKRNANNHRFSFFHEETEDSQGVKWGIYLNEERELNWVIPPKEINLSQLQWAAQKQLEKPVNAHLVVPVFKALDYPEKYAPPRPRNEQEKQRVYKKVKEEVIAHFPFPIAIGIRALFTPEMSDVSEKRLKLILDTYTNLSRLIVNILLAQLWNEKRKNLKKFRLNTEFKASYELFLKLTNKDFYTFNYGRFAKAISNAFWDNTIKPFIPESVQRDDEQQEAYNYLEELRQQWMQGRIKPEQALSFCNNAEYCLAILLRKYAFLANYEFVSVRDIKVRQIQRVQEDATYDHSVGVLIGDSVENTQYHLDKHIDSYSVIMIGADFNDQEENRYLNLCPFVIDEHTFDEKSEKPSLLFFAHSSLDKQAYYYQKIQIQTDDWLDQPKAEIVVQLQSESDQPNKYQQSFDDDAYELFDNEEEENQENHPSLDNTLYQQIKSQFDALNTDFN